MSKTTKLSVDDVKAFTGCTSAMPGFGSNNLETMLTSLLILEITNTNTKWTGSIDELVTSFLNPAPPKPRAKPAGKQTPYEMLINGPAAVATASSDSKSKAPKIVKPLRFSVAFLSQLEFINRCLAADFHASKAMDVDKLVEFVARTKPESPSLLVCTIWNKFYRMTSGSMPEVFVENMKPFLHEVRVTAVDTLFCKVMYALLSDFSAHIAPLMWCKLNSGVGFQVTEDHFHVYMINLMRYDISSKIIILIDDYTHDLKILNAKPPKNATAANAANAANAGVNAGLPVLSGLPVLNAPAATAAAMPALMPSSVPVSTLTQSPTSAVVSMLPPMIGAGAPALSMPVLHNSRSMPVLPTTRSMPVLGKLVSTYTIDPTHLDTQVLEYEDDDDTGGPSSE